MFICFNKGETISSLPRARVTIPDLTHYIAIGVIDV